MILCLPFTGSFSAPIPDFGVWPCRLRAGAAKKCHAVPVARGGGRLPTMPPQDEVTEVTGLLRAWRDGDARADEKLLERVYVTLRHIALGQLRGERAGHTLQPTALVHEAYLRLMGQREVDWRDRGHFFGLAAVTMRRILAGYA